jgi:hypothetical protein
MNSNCRFRNETEKTTVFPIDSSSLVSSCRTSNQREVVAKSAPGQRSTLQRSGPTSPTEIEDLIGSLVRTTPAAGYHPLLPHTKLYYKAGTECQIDMLNDSNIEGSIIFFLVSRYTN